MTTPPRVIWGGRVRVEGGEDESDGHSLLGGLMRRSKAEQAWERLE